MSSPEVPPPGPEVPPPGPEVVTPAVVIEGDERAPGTGPVETVQHPAKVMRIASMIKQLLDEVRQAPLDEAGRNRLKEIYQTSIEELCSGLSGDLRDELSRVSIPFAEGSTPTEPELRIAQAQLVGWLEGLFHGIQATMMAQQMAARAEIEDRGRRGLPPATSEGPDGGPHLVRPPGYL